MSNARNRDRSVDRLLRHTLRSGDVPEPGEACLDAESAAAWFDGGLAVDERHRLENHIADCARCQALVSAMAGAPADAPPTAEPSGRRWTGWLVPVSAVAVVLVVLLVPRWPAGPEPTERAAESQLAKPAPSRQELADATPRAAEPGRLAAARASDDPAEPSRAQAAPPAAPAQAVGRESARSAPAAEARRADEAAFAEAPAFQIASPEPDVRWRVTGSTIARTGDGGATWQTGVAPPGLSLVAGSAPSSSVCWLVGRAGAVLVTADGTNWERLSFPEAIDLSAVEATDSRTATVSAADGRVFATTDGGATWTRRSLQEFPTAPF